MSRVRDEATQPDEPRWPAVAALAAAWWLPATTARRTAHVGLLRAWGVHLLVILAALILIFLFAVAISVMKLDSGYARSFAQSAIYFAANIAQHCRRHPERVTVVVAFLGLALEGGYAVLALLVAPWGARDETVRESYLHALRWVWLHSSHALPILVIMLTVTALIENAAREWRRAALRMTPSSPTAQPAPRAAVTTPSGSATMRRPWRLQPRPWYRQYKDEILGYVGFACGTWALWALLRGAGARRRVAPAGRPPTCEMCGYNLTGAAPDGRCPECGAAVAESLGSGARPGALWERRTEVGLVRAWWRCAVDPVIRPSWFGRQVRLTPTNDSYRWFLAMHLPLIFVLGAAALAAGYVTATGWHPYRYEAFPRELLFIGLPLVGYLLAAAGLLLPIAAAGVVAPTCQQAGGRNLLGPAVQIAAYLSGYFVLWAAVSTGMGVVSGFLLRERMLDGLAELLQVPRGTIALMIWALPTATGVLLYLMLLSRGTTAARYANR